MARCLDPKTIPNPANWDKRQLRFLKDRPALFSSTAVTTYARSIRTYWSYPAASVSPVSRTSSPPWFVRCLPRGRAAGSFAFMTLTYDDDHLPIVETMWRVNLSDGSEEQVSPPDFASTGFHPEPAYLAFFKGSKVAKSPGTRLSYIAVSRTTSGSIVSLPPFVEKMYNSGSSRRIQYARDYNEPLPDFSYVAISGVWSQDLPSALPSRFLWTQALPSQLPA